MTEHEEMWPTQEAEIAPTDIAAPIAQAWSEGEWEWQTPTGPYPHSSNWAQRLVGAAKYVLPAAVVAVVLAFVLGGRPNAPVSHPTPAPPTAAPMPTITAPATPNTRPSSVDDKFMAALINHEAPVTDSKVAVNNALAVCDELGEGKSRTDITEEIRNATQGYDETNAAMFVALAVNYYCPKYGVTA